VILCHVVQRQERKFLVAHTRMGYVVMKCIAVPQIQFVPQVDVKALMDVFMPKLEVFPKLEAPRQ